MDEQRLFRLAPAGFACNAYYVGGDGWTVIMRMRRADETWGDTELIEYSHLTTVELVDVINAETFMVLLQRPDRRGEE